MTTLQHLRFINAHEQFGLDYDVLSPSQQVSIDGKIQYDLAEAIAYFEQPVRN